MSVDLLTTSGINSLITAYTTAQTSKRVNGLTSKKTTLQSLANDYTTLSSKLDPLKTIVSSLMATDSTSVFNATKSATSSNTGTLSVSASSSAAIGQFSVRVRQLVKSDTVLSSTLNASDSYAASAGQHMLRFRSGTSEANIAVNFSASETNQTAMQKISDAVNASSKASVSSSMFTGTDSYTMDSSNNNFDISLNGTATHVAISDADAATVTDYSSLVDTMVKNINAQASGISAEKVTDASTGKISLKLTAKSTTDSLTINSTGLDSGGNKISASNKLMDDIGVKAYNEKAANQIVSSTTFNPTSSQVKLSFSSMNAGYSNRLLISSEDSLSLVGLTSDVLSNRYMNSDDGVTTSQSKAGFSYGTQYIKTDLSVGGSAETSDNNGLNARLTFNGLSVQRETNSISDLVSGLTLNLTGTTKDTDADVTVNVNSSMSTAKSKITDFVSKFNTAYLYIKANTTVTKDGRGDFASDNTALSLQSSLSSIAYSGVDGISSGNIKQLSQLGINFDPQSGLTISDSATLDAKLAKSPDQVAALFTGTNGIATRLYSKLDAELGTTGAIASAKASINTNISSLSDRITTTQASITKSAELLRTKYTQLQIQLANLEAMATSFASYISTGTFSTTSSS